MTLETAKRLLVVDDEKTFCEVLKVRLESYGYNTSVVFDGREAWKAVSDSTPDLVLLDIRMPEEDGYTFLKRLRSFRDPEDSVRENRLRQLPVIIMTGTGDGMKPLFEQEHITAYITKPVDSVLLKKLIEKTLDKK